MRYRIFLFLLGMFFVNAGFSQHKFAFNTGYDYVGKSTGYLGGEYRIDNNSKENKNGPLTFGLGTYLYGDNGKFSIAPEAHIQKTWKHFLITELSASTKNVRPSIGLSFFNLTRLQLGYSFPIDNSGFKGFYFGFHILIGKSPFYDEITIF